MCGRDINHDDEEAQGDEEDDEEDDGEPPGEGTVVSPVAEVSTITKGPSTATMVPSAGGMLRI